MKTFFARLPAMKNYINFLIIFFINFALVSTAWAAVANIDRVVFTNDIQSVPVGEISGEINIQTQNSELAPEALDETGDLTLTSSSITGEFSSSNTTWKADEALTMNKTWSNRKFYYRDSASGSYAITATLTTRTTGKGWTATQAINVGTGGISGSGGSSSTTTNSTATTTNNEAGTSITSENSSTVISTHYNQENLSAYDEPSNIFEISAGRDRFGHVGSPFSFLVKTKKSKDVIADVCSYSWSFGDGGFEKMEAVDHSYHYAGDYNVVLNGECGINKSVSRTSVKILEPKLLLAKTLDGSVQITNLGKYEINLYGWKLSSLNQEYSFPLDTIIGAGKSVIFSKDYTKFVSPIGASLLNVYGQTVVSIPASYALLDFGDISQAQFDQFIENYKRLTSG